MHRLHGTDAPLQRPRPYRINNTSRRATINIRASYNCFIVDCRFYNLIDWCFVTIYNPARSTQSPVWSILPISRSFFFRYVSFYPSSNPIVPFRVLLVLAMDNIVADPSGKCEAAGETLHGRLNFSPIWISEKRYVTRRPGWACGPDFVHNF